MNFLQSKRKQPDIPTQFEDNNFLNDCYANSLSLTNNTNTNLWQYFD